MHFNLDIVQAVIDRLHDRDTLAACSLVCRDWAGHSQTLLLRSLAFKDQERLSTFLATIPAMSQHFLSRPRHLFLAAKSRSIYDGGLTITRSDLVSLLRSLPRVQEIDIFSVRLDISTDNFSEQLPDYRRSLSYLRFVDTGHSPTSTAAQHIAAILAFVFLFHAIKQLDITEQFPQRHHPEADVLLSGIVAPPVPLQLEELRVADTSFATALLLLFLSSGTARTVRMISAPRTSLLEVQQIIGTFPDVVESLELRYDNPADLIPNGKSFTCHRRALTNSPGKFLQLCCRNGRQVQQG